MLGAEYRKYTRVEREDADDDCTLTVTEERRYNWKCPRCGWLCDKDDYLCWFCSWLRTDDGWMCECGHLNGVKSPECETCGTIHRVG